MVNTVIEYWEKVPDQRTLSRRQKMRKTMQYLFNTVIRENKTIHRHQLIIETAKKYQIGVSTVIKYYYKLEGYLKTKWVCSKYEYCRIHTDEYTCIRDLWQ